MKTLLRLLPLLALAFVSVRADHHASTKVDPKILAAVEAADTKRVAAILAGDRAGLTAIFSDDLYFVHASGKLDTKESYTEALASKRTVYSKYTYQDRNFRQLAPGIVQMAGRVLVGTRTGELDLNFLAIWREEKGAWRFVAWQSARNMPTAETKK
jgi:hypothetical protein